MPTTTTKTDDLRKAALARAKRTLYQGLASGALVAGLTGALLALIGGDLEDARLGLVAAGGALVTVLGAAATSYFQGVYQGLPEAPEPALPVREPSEPLGGPGDYYGREDGAQTASRRAEERFLPGEEGLGQG